MSAFKKIWSGGLGVVTFAAALIITPIVSVYNGVDEMKKDNPQDVSNWGQFKEGASFGLIDAKNGLTPKSAADAVYDGGKAIGKGASKFGERLIERATEDFEKVSPPKKINSFLDPNADYSLPEDEPEVENKPDHSPE